MSVDWQSVISTVGSSAVIVAVAGFVLKSLFSHVLNRDLDRRKQELATENQRSIEALKAEHSRLLAMHRAEIESASARDERVRQEIEKWANPILGAIKDLERRLKNILKDEGHVALSPGASFDGDWRIGYSYFLPSTVFVFAQYFCWTRLLQERLTFDLFSAAAAKDAFLLQCRQVGRMLSSWPLSELDDLPPGGDMQVFTLQQRALGECLIVDGQCMRFAEFLDRWQDRAFRAKFASIETFLEGLTRETKRRWRRLELMRCELERLAEKAEIVLGPCNG